MHQQRVVERTRAKGEGGGKFVGVRSPGASRPQPNYFEVFKGIGEIKSRSSSLVYSSFRSLGISGYVFTSASLRIPIIPCTYGCQAFIKLIIMNGLKPSPCPHGRRRSSIFTLSRSPRMSLVTWIGIASIQISDEVETCLIYSHMRGKEEGSFTHQVSRQGNVARLQICRIVTNVWKHVSPSIHPSIVIQNDEAGGGTRSRAGVTFHFIRAFLIHDIWYDGLWRSRKGRDITWSPSDSSKWSCHSPLTLLQIRRIVCHQPKSNPDTCSTSQTSFSPNTSAALWSPSTWLTRSHLSSPSQMSNTLAQWRPARCR